MTNYIAESMWYKGVHDVDQQIYVSAIFLDYQFIVDSFVDYELFANPVY
jgi:hypothetical protein